MDGFELEHDASGLEAISLIDERHRKYGNTFKLIIVSETLNCNNGLKVCEDL